MSSGVHIQTFLAQYSLLPLHSAKTAVLNDDHCFPILHKGDVSSFVSTAIIRARKGWLSGQEQFWLEATYLHPATKPWRPGWQERDAEGGMTVSWDLYNRWGADIWEATLGPGEMCAL
ncbi:uncharacterized protein ARMOST_20250 [Armillaria ostoyae]|uniref:Uncharacterized protein n=1 Tax=Armillaria ostoyae TaxID=47428 RepID=A0A284S6U4_ARMOS|nr:uncharacterized protein ARMOST_20250 [Armillaria ostoyae]